MVKVQKSLNVSTFGRTSSTTVHVIRGVKLQITYSFPVFIVNHKTSVDSTQTADHESRFLFGCFCLAITESNPCNFRFVLAWTTLVWFCQSSPTHFSHRLNHPLLQHLSYIQFVAHCTSSCQIVHINCIEVPAFPKKQSMYYIWYTAVLFTTLFSSRSFGSVGSVTICARYPGKGEERCAWQNARK